MHLIDISTLLSLGPEYHSYDTVVLLCMSGAGFESFIDLGLLNKMLDCYTYRRLVFCVKMTYTQKLIILHASMSFFNILQLMLISRFCIRQVFLSVSKLYMHLCSFST